MSDRREFMALLLRFGLSATLALLYPAWFTRCAEMRAGPEAGPPVVVGEEEEQEQEGEEEEQEEEEQEEEQEEEEE